MQNPSRPNTRYSMPYRSEERHTQDGNAEKYLSGGVASAVRRAMQCDEVQMTWSR